MRKPLARRVLPVLAAAVMVLCASGSAATAAVRAAGPAAVAPGWRITKMLPNLVTGGLWAGGPRDAWLAGDGCADPATCGASDTSNGTVVVRHWDGTAWRLVAMPKAYVNTPLDQGVGAVAAASAKNAWVFAYRGTESVDYTDELHWTGKGWAKPVRMNAEVESAVAVAPDQVWAFGLPRSYKQHGYYAHFDGKTWKAGAFPVEATAAAGRSADDVWAGGRAASGALAIEHWDGHAWHATTITKPSSGVQLLGWVTGIAVSGARQVWVSVVLGSSDSGSSFVEHWDGTSWTRINVPYRGATIGSPLASDGHGGVWVNIDIGGGVKATTWFAHYAAGKWTKTRVPNPAHPVPSDATMIDHLTWIPGTRSLWATGLVDTADVSMPTVVYKYGP